MPKPKIFKEFSVFFDFGKLFTLFSGEITEIGTVVKGNATRNTKFRRNEPPLTAESAPFFRPDKKRLRYFAAVDWSKSLQIQWSPETGVIGISRK